MGLDEVGVLWRYQILEDIEGLLEFSRSPLPLTVRCGGEQLEWKVFVETTTETRMEIASAINAAEEHESWRAVKIFGLSIEI